MDDLIQPPKRYPIRITIIVVAIALLGAGVILKQLTGQVKIDYSNLKNPTTSERAAIEAIITEKAASEGVPEGTNAMVRIDRFDGTTAIGNVTFNNASSPKSYIVHKKGDIWTVISYKDK